MEDTAPVRRNYLNSGRVGGSCAGWARQRQLHGKWHG
jgi:hypothetical protein